MEKITWWSAATEGLLSYLVTVQDDRRPKRELFWKLDQQEPPSMFRDWEGPPLVGPAVLNFAPAAISLRFGL